MTSTSTYTALEPSLSQVIGTGNNLSFDLNNHASSMTDALTLVTTVAFTTIFVLGMTRLVFAGVLLVKAEGQAQMAEAKEVLKKVMFGIIGVLLMWLLLLWINPDMLRGDLGLGSIGVGSAGTQTVTATPTTGTPINPGTLTASQLALQTMVSTEATIRGQLNGVNVTSTNGNISCTSIGQTGCTSVGGLRADAITVLNQLRVACGMTCAVTITGGTEWWLHGNRSADITNSGTNHMPGNAVFDLNCSHGSATTCGTDQLSLFLKGQPSQVSTTSRCSEIFIYGGFKFCNETITGNPPHWHVEPQSILNG